ncbi:hypothetical protein MWU77_03790 [Rhodococcus sp. F64268]|uniref:hypothetical protein n=1 Tax=Rhodococcus sp. F64268 TaxID=2926402 RepID=UPI001FF17575|nr:hypothetical protein [Rhodococcus sp. F64268]MCK0089902.1 hypothetical protein [Rhodococcus sp. F64268]
MEVLLIGVIAIVVLVGVDQAALWAERRGWVYWRRSNPRTADAGSGMLGAMDELFSPAKRHVTEEIVGKRNGRIDIAVGDDGWIDLDSGRVRLSRIDHP